MKSQIKTGILGALFSFASFAAFSAPVNLVSNGSFENGLTDWSIKGTQGAFPVVALYNDRAAAYPIGAFGEAIPPANSTTLSPDAAGARAAYFVDNGSQVALQQTIFLTAGRYRIGFDVYAPKNGYDNPFDAMFSAQIAGVSLANYAVSSKPATTWQNYSGLADIQADGEYLVSFAFSTPGKGAAKDIVLDRVYVLESDEIGGTPITNNVPEPSSIALLGLGLAGVIGLKKRKPQ